MYHAPVNKSSNREYLCNMIYGYLPQDNFIGDVTLATQGCLLINSPTVLLSNSIWFIVGYRFRVTGPAAVVAGVN